MLTEVLRALYDYNHWATEIVLDTAAKLAPEQWLAPGTAGRGSVRDTLVHLVSAQNRWLAWWDGSHSAEDANRIRLDPADYPDLAAVRTAWAASDEAIRAFVARLSEADAVRVFDATLQDGRVFRSVLWKMLLHVANHGTQHRSEVAAMLTSFGYSPGDLDALRYFRPIGN
jgi:uncharacterized damage-inducible protein DinB